MTTRAFSGTDSHDLLHRCRDSVAVIWFVGWEFERRLWLGRHSWFHNVLFRAAHDGDQFLLLFGGDLEFVQGLPEISDQRPTGPR